MIDPYEETGHCPPRMLRGRKVLVASVGVAAITFLACGESSGNLLPPPSCEAGACPRDAAADAARDAAADAMTDARPIDAGPG